MIHYVKIARRRRHKTIEEVAYKAEMSVGRYCMIENDKREMDVHEAMAIAKAIGCRISELIGVNL